MVRQIATDPAQFMERKVGQARIRLEIVVVLLVGLLSVPGILYVTLQILDVESSAEMRIAVASRVIRPLFVVLVLWVFYTVVLHFLASHYGGRSPPSQVLKGTAWALIPMGIGNLVQSGALFLAVRGTDISAEMTEIDPAENIQTVFDSSMTDPVMIAGTVLFMLTIVLSGYLMTFAIQHAKGIERPEAVRTVAVPVTLHTLVVAWGLVGGVTNFGMIFVISPY